jgi:sugar phosphate isomerase/epimerase
VRPIGFSTGAIAKRDFQFALTRLRQLEISVVELSALRFDELDPLVLALPGLDLRDFEFVSFHAPSRFAAYDEQHVIRALQTVVERRIPVVVHPDVIARPEAWASFGEMLLIENMDKRKPIGRTAEDLERLFRRFPEAGFCFDLGHARQVDPTMTEAQIILERFGERLREVHVSDVNTSSRHDPLSIYAMSAFRSVSLLIPDSIPVVLETLIDQGQSDILTEIDRAQRALNPSLEQVVDKQYSYFG